MVIKLVTHFFFYMNLPSLDASINFHLVAYKEMKCLEEKERFIISLMFLNYTLLFSDMQILFRCLPVLLFSSSVIWYFKRK